MSEFRETILGDHEPDMGFEPLPPLVLKVPEGTPAFPRPGIYFGMPEEEYHRIVAVSASGQKRFSRSSMDWWATSAFNTDYEPTQRNYLDFGKATHAFVLEGEEAYLSRYVVALDPSDFDGALISTDEIKAAIKRHSALQPVTPVGRAKQPLIDQLADLGERHGREVNLDTTVDKLQEQIRSFEEEAPVLPVSKVPDVDDEGNEIMRSAVKDDWINQLLELAPDTKVWDRILAEHEAEHEGKDFISAKDDRRIRVSHRMIMLDPEIGPLFKGGHAEVSIFWYCPMTGVPMKARIDYLRLRAIVDLKTIGNTKGMPIDRAIENTIASYRYNLQHVIYDEAVEAAKLMVRTQGVDCINQPVHTYDEDVLHWCEQWASIEEPATFVFVFQQSGIAPVTRGVTMPRTTTMGGIFGATQARSIDLRLGWREAAETYGTDPWLDIKPITNLADEEIAPWATEI